MLNVKIIYKKTIPELTNFVNLRYNSYQDANNCVKMETHISCELQIEHNVELF